MRPHIALVAAGLDIIGGQGVQARTLADKLREEGCGVIFIPINPRFPRWLGKLRQVPYVRTILNQALYLPKLLQLRNADVAHIFSASYGSFLLAPVPAMLAARALGKRVILNYHSGEAGDHLARWGMWVHPWLRLADQIVVPSQYLKDIFAAHGYAARVIHNAVDVSRFRFRERNPLRPVFLSTRNLDPYYRVDVTIRAFALIQDCFPEAKLTIAGYGAEEERLKGLADSVGGGRVRFLGRIEPAAMPRVYDEADIFLNSSVVDNQPLSVLEAFASGLPVVSTPTGDIAGMVRAGETGRVVPVENPAAMAEAVIELLEKPDDARRMARRARGKIQQYCWPAVRANWLDVYRAEGRAVVSRGRDVAARADESRAG